MMKGLRTVLGSKLACLFAGLSYPFQLLVSVLPAILRVLIFSGASREFFHLP